LKLLVCEFRENCALFHKGICDRIAFAGVEVAAYETRVLQRSRDPVRAGMNVMERALLRRYERKENAIQEEAERRREVPRQRGAAGAACASRWTGSCARSGVTTPQYSVLSAIAAYPGVSNARLARLAFVTPQTV